MQLNELYSKLNSLESQKQSIDKEILETKKIIEKLSPFTKQQKISLFKSLFIAREDVYPTYWVNKDGTKKGYSPVTYTFRGQDYIPINDNIIQKHLEGKIRLGTYAVVNQTMTKFLVIDLDKASFIQDTRAINKICNELNITPLVELSKSGNGIHTENKTVFIDIDTMQPYPDQWSILKTISKISSIKLSNLLQSNLTVNKNDIDSLMPWEIKQNKPISFPKTTKAVIHEALYIEKMELSKILLNTLQRLSSFINPEFYIRQNLRKSTFNTPRIISLFDMNERYVILPRGLTSKVQHLFESNNASLIIEDKRFTKKVDKPKLTIKLRDNQKTAYNKILKNNYALLIAPPGFGKTAIASAVIAKRRVNTLILVHKITLLEQWAERLSEYFEIDKKSLGQLGKGKKRITSNIDIAMLQSLKNRPELIEDYSQIIVDEAHHIPAVSFEVPLKKFRGKYVVGLSATPKRQDGMHPIMSMQCGEIVHEVKRDKEQTHILKSIRTKFEANENEFTMILGELIEDFERNVLIINEIEKLKDRKILIISERIEHLNILYHGLKSKNIKSTLLHGGMGTKVQRAALKEAHSANIILSTSGYIGEGIDFAHLDTIVFTMPISYQGRIIQYLGRVGRRGQKCLAMDFVDENVPMLKSSFTKRLKGYKQMGYKHMNNEKSALNLFT